MYVIIIILSVILFIYWYTHNYVSPPPPPSASANVIVDWSWKSSPTPQTPDNLSLPTPSITPSPNFRFISISYQKNPPGGIMFIYHNQMYSDLMLVKCSYTNYAFDKKPHTPEITVDNTKISLSSNPVKYGETVITSFKHPIKIQFNTTIIPNIPLFDSDSDFSLWLESSLTPT